MSDLAHAFGRISESFPESLLDSAANVPDEGKRPKTNHPEETRDVREPGHPPHSSTCKGNIMKTFKNLAIVLTVGLVSTFTASQVTAPDRLSDDPCQP